MNGKKFGDSWEREDGEEKFFLRMGKTVTCLKTEGETPEEEQRSIVLWREGITIGQSKVRRE